MNGDIKKLAVIVNTGRYKKSIQQKPRVQKLLIKKVE